ncbi:MAG: ATP-binding cassette domain-containing protein [Zetaproteobacteria bacterium]|nr:ATP-binding cassette domain-containing protein [Zetaproteobacteria bacterium]
MESAPLVEVNAVSKYFPTKKNLFGKVIERVNAVQSVDLRIHPGETVGLVGESGCGKSTLGRTVIRLYQPDGGRIRFQGQDVTHMKHAHLRALRRQMQIVFQDPFSSLNPRMSIESILLEPFVIHGVGTHVERKKRVCELLELVGLDSDCRGKYPHEFSGGQRQRIGIARAIALNPSFVVADEPVSALDVSIQSQILNLLIQLKKEMGLAYLFIAHDLAVVYHISDRIGVMYLGKIVELADAEDLYTRRLHPYTQALIAAIPVAEYREARRDRKIPTLSGDIPNPIFPPSGCSFHTRCPHAQEKCRTVVPEYRNVGSEKKPHMVACHYV